MKRPEIRDLLRDIAAELPEVPQPYGGGVGDPRDSVFVERVTFDISLLLDRLELSRSTTVVDIGGGFGLFSAGIAALGSRSIMVDDNAHWREPGLREHFEEAKRVWDRHGVEVVERDVIADGLGDLAGDLDAVTNFHFMEHMHVSPRGLFHEATARLKPGGVFALAAPNCANIRKRLSAVAGRTSWSPLEQWYREPSFRGHVREPSVQDLRYIARDIGLREAAIYGRNFIGLASPKGATRAIARLSDPLLRLRPSLCSDLYLVGRK